MMVDALRDRGPNVTQSALAERSALVMATSSGSPMHWGHDGDGGQKSVAECPHPCASRTRPNGGDDGICQTASTPASVCSVPERFVEGEWEDGRE